MRTEPFLCALLCLFLGEFTSGAKILAVLPVASPSHGIWNKALIEALADKGHDLTVLSANSGKNRPNLRYVEIENSFEGADDIPFADIAALNSFGNIVFVFEWLYMTCQMQIKANGTREAILDSKERYDLIIYESTGVDCFLGTMHKFAGTPSVAISAYGFSCFNCDPTGVWCPPSTVPVEWFPVPDEMSFWQRLHNWVLVQTTKLTFHWYHTPRHQTLAEKAFGPLPPIRSLDKFDLFLSNTGPVGVDLARHLPPNVKEVGCVQCRKGKPLEKDLQEYLDSAKNGFIFMSFGSNVKSSLLPKEKIDIFLKVFGELDIKVLWKFETDLPQKPKNVMIKKWLPQQDILAHENIKLFITHGGRLSVQESMYHGVPMLAVPFFADQYINGQKAVNKGVGLKLHLPNLTAENWKNSIETILNNPGFSERAKRLSLIASDELESPLERAVFWTEYVIRHKGAKHLQPAGSHLNWVQLHSLDVISFLMTILIVTATVALLAIKLILELRKKQKLKKK
ncbi:UDP-glucosyltransferase 2-like [Neocloeon triangulifer]|uniref:UDP-glucosyltransferase 2-like n=1 Tax=Neocloeon triangulifer TaxID=2078957 RepID=UPI00286F37D8|nr:UDP-glucosyltransferase 2-like [Neocloeon triangulifer]